MERLEKKPLFEQNLFFITDNSENSFQLQNSLLEMSHKFYGLSSDLGKSL
jgi:hypothetical protein